MRAVITGIIFSILLVGQQAGDYSISGVVLNAQTGEPVKYALVTLMSFQAPDQSQPRGRAKPPFQKSTQAGSGGEFQFNGLGKAHYSVSAQKPGFYVRFVLEEANSQQVDLHASMSGVQLKLSPLGVIEGKVVDQNDEPLRGVNIVALQVNINDGFRETRSLRSVATDDRGVYRLWNLAPGQYYIKAAGKSGGTYRYVGDSTAYYSSWESFTPVYFGGGRTLDSATSIQIDSGSKASADLRLNIEPAFRIKGTLANIPGETVTFELLQGAEDVSASRTTLNVTSGKFEVQDVTPGTYLLRATQGAKMRGETVVTVNQGDVNDVSLSLAPAVAVQGITRVIGPPIKAKDMPGFARAVTEAGGDPNDKIEEFEQGIEPMCNVSLHERGGRLNNTASQRGLKRALGDPEHGVFSLGEVLPGTYRVQVMCNGGYPTSVLAGGVDLLSNPNLLIQPGIAPPSIEIQVKSGGGTLSGEFAVRPIPKAAGVLLVPAFSNSTGPLMIQVWANSESKDKVEFGQPFLAPGDYVVYAFSEWQQIEYRDPAFLQTLSGGVSVRIEDGKEQQVTVNKLVK